MFELVFDVGNDKEKREKGADNLVVIAREKSGAEMLHKEGAIERIARLMKVEQNVNIRLSLIRSIGEMCKKSQEIAKSVLKECGIPFFLDILNSTNEEVVNASSYIIQVYKKPSKYGSKNGIPYAGFLFSEASKKKVHKVSSLVNKSIHFTHCINFVQNLRFFSDSEDLESSFKSFIFSCFNAVKRNESNK